MASQTRSARQMTAGEEVANAVTHGIGALLAVAGLVTMVAIAVTRGDAWHLVSTAVYGSTLILLYGASALYHGATAPRAKRVLKHLDHASIYLLIAGTYTPFTLVTLRGPWGWSIFGTIWGLALLGVSLEGLWLHRPRWLAAAVYVAMGWIIVVAIGPLAAHLARPGLILLFAGGVAYTAGTVFYVAKRVPYMHAVWHGWVLAGSACHFLAVLRYVLPA